MVKQHSDVSYIHTAYIAKCNNTLKEFSQFYVNRVQVIGISGVKAPETHLNCFSGKLLPEQVQAWLPENKFLLQSVPKQQQKIS